MKKLLIAFGFFTVLNTGQFLFAAAAEAVVFRSELGLNRSNESGLVVLQKKATAAKTKYKGGERDLIAGVVKEIDAALNSIRSTVISGASATAARGASKASAEKMLADFKSTIGSTLPTGCPSDAADIRIYLAAAGKTNFGAIAAWTLVQQEAVAKTLRAADLQAKITAADSYTSSSSSSSSSSTAAAGGPSSSAAVMNYPDSSDFADTGFGGCLAEVQKAVTEAKAAKEAAAAAAVVAKNEAEAAAYIVDKLASLVVDEKTAAQRAFKSSGGSSVSSFETKARAEAAFEAALASVKAEAEVAAAAAAEAAARKIAEDEKRKAEAARRLQEEADRQKAAAEEKARAAGKEAQAERVKAEELSVEKEGLEAQFQEFKRSFTESALKNADQYISNPTVIKAATQVLLRECALDELMETVGIPEVDADHLAAAKVYLVSVGIKEPSVEQIQQQARRDMVAEANGAALDEKMAALAIAGKAIKAGDVSKLAKIMRQQRYTALLMQKDHSLSFEEAKVEAKRVDALIGTKDPDSEQAITADDIEKKLGGNPAGAMLYSPDFVGQNQLFCFGYGTLAKKRVKTADALAPYYLLVSVAGKTAQEEQQAAMASQEQSARAAETAKKRKQAELDNKRAIEAAEAEVAEITHLIGGYEREVQQLQTVWEDRKNYQMPAEELNAVLEQYVHEMTMMAGAEKQEEKEEEKEELTAQESTQLDATWGPKRKELSGMWVGFKKENKYPSIFESIEKAIAENAGTDLIQKFLRITKKKYEEFQAEYKAESQTKAQPVVEKKAAIAVLADREDLFNQTEYVKKLLLIWLGQQQKVADEQEPWGAWIAAVNDKAKAICTMDQAQDVDLALLRGKVGTKSTNALALTSEIDKALFFFKKFVFKLHEVLRLYATGGATTVEEFLIHYQGMYGAVREGDREQLGSDLAEAQAMLEKIESQLADASEDKALLALQTSYQKRVNAKREKIQLFDKSISRDICNQTQYTALFESWQTLGDQFFSSSYESAVNQKRMVMAAKIIFAVQAVEGDIQKINDIAQTETLEKAIVDLKSQESYVAISRMLADFIQQNKESAEDSEAEKSFFEKTLEAKKTSALQAAAELAQKATEFATAAKLSDAIRLEKLRKEAAEAQSAAEALTTDLWDKVDATLQCLPVEVEKFLDLARLFYLEQMQDRYKAADEPFFELCNQDYARDVQCLIDYPFLRSQGSLCESSYFERAGLPLFEMVNKAGIAVDLSTPAAKFVQNVLLREIKVFYDEIYLKHTQQTAKFVAAGAMLNYLNDLLLRAKAGEPRFKDSIWFHDYFAQMAFHPLIVTTKDLLGTNDVQNCGIITCLQNISMVQKLKGSLGISPRVESCLNKAVGIIKDLSLGESKLKTQAFLKAQVQKLTKEIAMSLARTTEAAGQSDSAGREYQQGKEEFQENLKSLFAKVNGAEDYAAAVELFDAEIKKLISTWGAAKNTDQWFKTSDGKSVLYKDFLQNLAAKWTGLANKKFVVSDKKKDSIVRLMQELGFDYAAIQAKIGTQGLEEKYEEQLNRARDIFLLGYSSGPAASFVDLLDILVSQKVADNVMGLASVPAEDQKYYKEKFYEKTLAYVLSAFPQPMDVKLFGQELSADDVQSKKSVASLLDQVRGMRWFFKSLNNPLLKNLCPGVQEALDQAAQTYDFDKVNKILMHYAVAQHPLFAFEDFVKNGVEGGDYQFAVDDITDADIEAVSLKNLSMRTVMDRGADLTSLTLFNPGGVQATKTKVLLLCKEMGKMYKAFPVQMKNLLTIDDNTPLSLPLLKNYREKRKTLAEVENFTASLLIGDGSFIADNLGTKAVTQMAAGAAGGIAAFGGGDVAASGPFTIFTKTKGPQPFPLVSWKKVPDATTLDKNPDIISCFLLCATCSELKQESSTFFTAFKSLDFAKIVTLLGKLDGQGFTATDCKVIFSTDSLNKLASIEHGAFTLFAMAKYYLAMMFSAECTGTIEKGSRLFLEPLEGIEIPADSAVSLHALYEVCKNDAYTQDKLWDMEGDAQVTALTALQAPLNACFSLVTTALQEYLTNRLSKEALDAACSKVGTKPELQFKGAGPLAVVVNAHKEVLLPLGVAAKSNKALSAAIAAANKELKRAFTSRAENYVKNLENFMAQGFEIFFSEEDLQDKSRYNAVKAVAEYLRQALQKTLNGFPKSIHFNSGKLLSAEGKPFIQELGHIPDFMQPFLAASRVGGLSPLKLQIAAGRLRRSVEISDHYVLKTVDQKITQPLLYLMRYHLLPWSAHYNSLCLAEDEVAEICRVDRAMYEQAVVLATQKRKQDRGGAAKSVESFDLKKLKEALARGGAIKAMDIYADDSSDDDSELDRLADDPGVDLAIPDGHAPKRLAQLKPPSGHRLKEEAVPVILAARVYASLVDERGNLKLTKASEQEDGKEVIVLASGATISDPFAIKLRNVKSPGEFTKVIQDAATGDISPLACTRIIELYLQKAEITKEGLQALLQSLVAKHANIRELLNRPSTNRSYSELASHCEPLVITAIKNPSMTQDIINVLMNYGLDIPTIISEYATKGFSLGQIMVNAAVAPVRDYGIAYELFDPRIPSYAAPDMSPEEQEEWAATWKEQWKGAIVSVLKEALIEAMLKDRSVQTPAVVDGDDAAAAKAIVVHNSDPFLGSAGTLAALLVRIAQNTDICGSVGDILAVSIDANDGGGEKKISEMIEGLSDRFGEFKKFVVTLVHDGYRTDTAPAFCRKSVESLWDKAFEILQLDVHSNPDEEAIKMAYKQRLLVVHPDKNDGVDQGTQDVRAAYAYLTTTKAPRGKAKTRAVGGHAKPAAPAPRAILSPILSLVRSVDEAVDADALLAALTSAALQKAITGRDAVANAVKLVEAVAKHDSLIASPETTKAIFDQLFNGDPAEKSWIEACRQSLVEPIKVQGKPGPLLLVKLIECQAFEPPYITDFKVEAKMLINSAVILALISKQEGDVAAANARLARIANALVSSFAAHADGLTLILSALVTAAATKKVDGSYGALEELFALITNTTGFDANVWKKTDAGKFITKTVHLKSFPKAYEQFKQAFVAVIPIAVEGDAAAVAYGPGLAFDQAAAAEPMLKSPGLMQICGNDCFINTMLQCIFSSPALVNYVHRVVNSEDTAAAVAAMPVARTLKTVFNEYFCRKNVTYDALKAFDRAMRNLADAKDGQTRGTGQGDPAEMFTRLFQQLAIIWPCETPIETQDTVTKTCHNPVCAQNGIKQETLGMPVFDMSIELPIKRQEDAQMLLNLIDKYEAVEYLIEVECDTCHEKRAAAEKQLLIVPNAPVMTFYVKRRGFNQLTRLQYKIETPLCVEEEFELKGARYRLAAIGDHGGVHWQARKKNLLVFNPTSDRFVIAENKWELCSDSSVSSIASPAGSESTSATLLVYELVPSD